MTIATPVAPRYGELGLINPLAPEFQADPYPIYRELRQLEPVYWSPLGYAFLSRFHDIHAVLRSSAAIIGEMHRVDMLEEGGALQNTLGRWILSIDDPAHKRIRRLVSVAFTPRRVAGLEGVVERLTAALLDELAGSSEFELISQVASQLPSLVVCELLGVPPEDRGRCIGWTRHIATSIDIIRTPAMIEAAERSALAFDAYFRGLVAERRAHPRGDLTSDLAAVSDTGDALTDDEIVANLILLFSAGHHTTSGLLGNAITALIRRPNQMRLFRDRIDEIEPMVEELLRFDSPVQMNTRVLVSPVELRDELLPAGTRLAILLGAGNHDPEVFERPDELDLTRRGVRPLSFSAGGHYCLGAPLARLEGRVMLRALIERTSEIDFADGGPRWATTCTLRGPEELRLAVRWR